ncbi:MAG: hypothetical protein RDV48_12085 [Candidatus Eremiobacteraeota bacterium]|nr:hypothetical protein [Candidatus Eremiobacteraeota bacterium]
MNVRPVNSYDEARYPRLEGGPGARFSPLPVSWRRKALVAGAALAFSALAWEGAAAQDVISSIMKPPSAIAGKEGCGRQGTGDAWTFLLAAAEKGVLVAPLFARGEGRGSSGGIAARPLTTLTEDEARNIIENELRKSGVSFDRHKVAVGGAVVEGAAGKEKVPLVADGLDTKHNLAYEYVPAREYEKIDKIDKGLVTEVNYKAFAESVRQGFLKEGTLNAAVFYDPMPEGYKKADAEKLLRMQVQDFVKWAKEQGIL